MKPTSFRRRGTNVTPNVSAERDKRSRILQRCLRTFEDERANGIDKRRTRSFFPEGPSRAERKRKAFETMAEGVRRSDVSGFVFDPSLASNSHRKPQEFLPHHQLLLNGRIFVVENPRKPTSLIEVKQKINDDMSLLINTALC